MIVVFVFVQKVWSSNELGKLYDYLNGSSSRLGIPLNATVGSLITNGRWRIPPARSEEQLQLQTHLTTLQLNGKPDYYEWDLGVPTASRYSTGETYNYLRPQRPRVTWVDVVWTKRGIPRHNFHLWLVLQDRIPTRDRLISWGLQVSPSCLLCNAANESRDHLFQDCSFSFNLWTQLARKLRLSPLRNWDATLGQMIALPKGKPPTLLSYLAWQAMIYWLWNERNARLHSNTFHSADTIYTTIYRQLKNKIQSFRPSNPTMSSAMMQLWI